MKEYRSKSGLRQQIVASAESLTRQQRVIADYLLEHLQEIPFLSSLELAERTGTSEATVVRLSQRIGYRGFSELKMALIDVLREERPTEPAPDYQLGSHLDKDVLAAMARLEQHNIARTLDSIDRETFDAVARLLGGADLVFCFGLGISAYLADLASYLLTEHGVRASSQGARFTSPREQLVVLRPTDVVLVFSFQPYSPQSLEVLEEARARGLDSVAVTDRATAPAAGLATHALTVSCEGMTFTNTTASIDVLLNALAVRIAANRHGESMEVLSHINQILAHKSDA